MRKMRRRGCFFFLLCFQPFHVLNKKTSSKVGCKKTQKINSEFFFSDDFFFFSTLNSKLTSSILESATRSFKNFFATSFFLNFVLQNQHSHISSSSLSQKVWTKFSVPQRTLRVAKKKMSSEKKKALSIFKVFLHTTFDKVFLFCTCDKKIVKRS